MFFYFPELESGRHSGIAVQSSSYLLFVPFSKCFIFKLNQNHNLVISVDNVSFFSLFLFNLKPQTTFKLFQRFQPQPLIQFRCFPSLDLHFAITVKQLKDQNHQQIKTRKICTNLKPCKTPVTSLLPSVASLQDNKFPTPSLPTCDRESL